MHRPVSENLVQTEVDRFLSATPAYAGLEPATQKQMRDAITRISSFLAAGTPARQFAPDLSGLRPGGGVASSPSAPSTPAPTSPGSSSGSAPAATAPSSGSPTSRVGEVARATLSAIDFPSFVASLIQGTFQAIVDASIQQMEAYATLLKNAALTVDAFMTDNVTDGMAQDYLADRYDGVIQRDTSGTAPRLTVGAADSGQSLPSFFTDLGIQTPQDLDDTVLQEKVVPATRRFLAEQRQQTLATMVLMGINRIVVSDGEISAKLQFHIDASEKTTMRFDQSKNSAMSMAGTAGRSPFSAQGIMVNTASLNAQSDVNVRADLVGNVVVRFRSETFPLERFADSAAIQLINTRARVPSAPAQTSTSPASPATPPTFSTPGAAPAAPGSTTAPAAPGSTTTPAPPAPGHAPAQPSAPAQQSLSGDPWGEA